MSNATRSEDLQEVLKDAEHAVEGEKVSIREILDAVSSRGFGPLLLMPALISISPVGAIPGMSIITGTLIALIAVQMLFRNDHPWIPQKIQDFSFSKSKYENGIEYLMPWAEWVSKWLSERWTQLVEPPFYYLTPVVMLVLAVSYYPLALVPMGVFLPGLANTMFAIGLTVRDGLLITLGHVFTIATLVTLYMFWPF